MPLFSRTTRVVGACLVFVVALAAGCAQPTDPVAAPVPTRATVTASAAATRTPSTAVPTTTTTVTVAPRPAPTQRAVPPWGDLSIPTAATSLYGKNSTNILPQFPIQMRWGNVTSLTAAQKANLTKFLTDVEKGDVATMAAKCWTYSPAYVADRYGTPAARGAILAAVAQGIGRTERGAGAVLAGSGFSVKWDNSELDSPYPCPHVYVGHDVPDFAAPDFAWLIHRLASRLKSSPVNKSENNYWLYCGNDTGTWPDAQGRERPAPGSETSTATIDALATKLDGVPITLAVPKVGGSSNDLFLIQAAPGTGPRLAFYRTYGGEYCIGDTFD